MADQHINRLTNDPSDGVCENEFAISDTWIIDNYTDGDWNGNSTYIAKFYSDTPGSQATIDISAIGDISVSYCNFQDINITGGIVSALTGCINSGNNTNIKFPSGGNTIGQNMNEIINNYSIMEALWV